MTWAATGSNLPLTVYIDGTLVGDTTGTTHITSATWGAGRGDWFESLTPASATFTFNKSLSVLGLGAAADVVGTDVNVFCGVPYLFVGVVDTAVEDEQLDGQTITTITCIDQVGMLGQARLEDENLTGPDSLDNQLPDVFTFAGLSATVSPLPGYQTAVLAAINPLSGNVLSWLTQAELDSNVVIAPAADGTILICDRGNFGDYGDRVNSTYYTGTACSSLWRMDETATTLFDTGEGLFGFDATKAGTPTYSQTGPWGANGGNAVAFQKADAADEFSIGDHYDLTTAAWTIAGWAYWDGTTSSNNTIVSKLATGPTNGWVVRVNTSSKLVFEVQSAGSVTSTVTSSASFPVNTWTHWAVTLGSSVYTVYINGVSQGTGASVVIPNTAAGFRWGSQSSSSAWWGGKQCMLAVWTVAITAANLLRLINPDTITVSGALAPYAWTTSTSITTVINHWIFRQFGGVSGYTNGVSIGIYGDHTFELDSDATTALSDSYSAANRTALADPRPVVTASFHIQTNSQLSLVTLQPLDYIIRGSTEWQVMSTSHSITPDSWDLTVQLSGTVAALTTGEPLLPV